MIQDVLEKQLLTLYEMQQEYETKDFDMNEGGKFRYGHRSFVTATQTLWPHHNYVITVTRVVENGSRIIIGLKRKLFICQQNQFESLRTYYNMVINRRVLFLVR